ncbi:MAG: hypothetical protein JRD89_04910 [Deltaproteobacteria bacterium]|nr:hypothetical protein [Deltaproteobacteria bacterium]
MHRKDLPDDRVKIAAIVCLTVIVCVAMAMGYDHALLAMTSAIIGGIAGYEVKLKVAERQKRR